MPTMMDKPYWFRVLVSLTQLLNTVCGGDPDETTSSRVGRLQAKFPDGRIPFWRYPGH